MEAKFKIEKDIPIPKRIKELKYDYDELEIGDSVLFKNEIEGRKFIDAFRKYTIYKNLNWIILTRRSDSGIRVWRIQ